MTQINGKIRVDVSEELILLKCPYFPKPEQIRFSPYRDYSGIAHKNRKKYPKICVDPQKTLKSQSNLEEKKE